MIFALGTFRLKRTRRTNVFWRFVLTVSLFIRGGIVQNFARWAKVTIEVFIINVFMFSEESFVRGRVYGRAGVIS